MWWHKQFMKGVKQMQKKKLLYKGQMQDASLSCKIIFCFRILQLQLFKTPGLTLLLHAISSHIGISVY